MLLRKSHDWEKSFSRLLLSPSSLEIFNLAAAHEGWLVPQGPAPSPPVAAPAPKCDEQGETSPSQQKAEGKKGQALIVLSCFQVAVPAYTDFSQQETEFSPYFHCRGKVTLSLHQR